MIPSEEALYRTQCAIRQFNRPDNPKIAYYVNYMNSACHALIAGSDTFDSVIDDLRKSNAILHDELYHASVNYTKILQNESLGELGELLFHSQCETKTFIREIIDCIRLINALYSHKPKCRILFYLKSLFIK